MMVSEFFCKFQSSLPRGERQRTYKKEVKVFSISILAPARGATSENMYRYSKLLFQSSLPRGERQLIGSMTIHLMQFQSSLPRGERLDFDTSGFDNMIFQSSLPRGERQRALMDTGVFLRNFNPRSREGSDSNVAAICFPFLRISILAPARGATRVINRLQIRNQKFQSSLPRGERRSI